MESLTQCLLGQGARASYDVGRQPSICDPEHPCDGPRRLAEAHQPGLQQVAQQRGQRLIGVGHAGQLLGEQRQAPTALVDRRHDLRRRRPAEHQGQLLGGLLAGERGQGEHGSRGETTHASQPRGRGVRRARVVGPEGTQHGHRKSACGQVLDQVQRGCVPPVQVLDDEGEGLQVAERLRVAPTAANSRWPDQSSLRLRVGVDDALDLGHEPLDRAPRRRGRSGPVLRRTSRRRRSRRRARSASANGSSGTAVERGRQWPVATKVSVVRGCGGDELGLADAGLAGDEEEAGAGLEVASYGGELGRASGDPGGAGARAGRWGGGGEPEVVEGVVSPSMASTRSSRVPQVGIAGEENALETVVWETPASRARVRRDGQPARWWRSWRAATRSWCGPGGRSGRGSALIVHLRRWPRSRWTAGRARGRRWPRAGAVVRPGCPARRGVRPGRRASGSTPRRGAG